MIKNRVVVFGGTGFIGKSFSDLLSKKIEHKSIGSKKINF